jgi:hypothetical protein
MKVTMLLADAAQAVEGKLYILGGGWSIIGPEPSPMAFAITIELLWTEADIKHQFRLALHGEDGQLVTIMTPNGTQPIEIKSYFEVGIPPGLRPGTRLNIPIAINISPFPLPAGKHYVWRCYINEKLAEEVNFSTRPHSTPQE